MIKYMKFKKIKEEISMLMLYLSVLHELVIEEI